MVQRLLAKEKSAGSNPVSRSEWLMSLTRVHQPFCFLGVVYRKIDRMNGIG